MKRTPIIAGGIIILLAILLLSANRNSGQLQSIPEVTPTQFMPVTQNTYESRYCEILPAYRSGLTLTLEVYVTSGLNDCPDALWQQINADALKDEYGAIAVKKNGPRFWLMNEATASGATVEGRIVEIGGIQMRQVAVVEASLSDVADRGGFYFENEVQRTTTYIYYAGTMVYELISPDGDVYRMQSYSQIVDSTLTTDDLAQLGERLGLPDGWRYEARVLTEESRLDADGLAFVIQDELENSYQKVTP